MSLLTGTGILYFIDFRGAGSLKQTRHTAFDVVVGACMMYGVSLAASAFMLWFFGRFDESGALVMSTQTVALAFPASLGASAGRLLLQ